MDFATYKIIHYAGIFLLLFSLGSLFTKYNKGAAMGHGIALLIIVVAGFGMQARQKAVYISHHGSSFPNWMIAKMAIWVLFGAAVVLAKRKIIQGPAAYITMVVLAVAAAYLALYKPF